MTFRQKVINSLKELKFTLKLHYCILDGPLNPSMFFFPNLEPLKIINNFVLTVFDKPWSKLFGSSKNLWFVLSENSYTLIFKISGPLENDFLSKKIKEHGFVPNLHCHTPSGPLNPSVFFF